MSTIRTVDGIELYMHEWMVENSIATVALFHGYGEHAGRYAHVAEAFNAKKISLMGADLRGHGLSPGTRGHIDRFGDYHLDATALYEASVKAAAGGPVFVFAHSMGGLLAFDWLSTVVERQLTGVVITSPFLGLALEINLMKTLLANVMSFVYPSLTFPSGVQGRDVTRNDEIAEKYDSDPLNHNKATVRWYTEAMTAIGRVHGGTTNIRQPLLLLYGGDDRVVSADATDSFAAGLKGMNKTMERLAGHYHELVNEPPEYGTRIIERIADWILTRATE